MNANVEHQLSTSERVAGGLALTAVALIAVAGLHAAQPPVPTPAAPAAVIAAIEAPPSESSATPPAAPPPSDTAKREPQPSTADAVIAAEPSGAKSLSAPSSSDVATREPQPLTAEAATAANPTGAKIPSAPSPSDVATREPPPPTADAAIAAEPTGAMSQSAVDPGVDDVPTAEEALEMHRLITTMLEQPATVRFDDATRIQRYLIAAGFLHGVADGVWGPRSRMALRDFRLANGLGLDDALDGWVQRTLFTTLSNQISTTSRPQPSGAKRAAKAATPGAERSPLNLSGVTWIQARFSELAHFLADREAGHAGSRAALLDVESLHGRASEAP
jgi:hypothetical protein